MRRIPWFLALLAPLAGACAGPGDGPTQGESASAWRLLADGDVPARLDAIGRIEAAFPEDARGIPWLVAAMEDDDARVRDRASQAVERIGLRSVRETAAFLRGSENADLAGFTKTAKFLLTLERTVVITPKDLAAGMGGGDAAGAALLVGLVDFPASASGGIAPYDAYLLLLGRASLREAGDVPFARDLARLSTWALGVQACGTLAPSSVRDVPEEVRALSGEEAPWKRWAAAALLARLRSTSPESTRILEGLASAPEKGIAATARRARGVPADPPPSTEAFEALLADVGSSSMRRRSEAEPQLLVALPTLPPADRARALAALVRRPDRAAGVPYVAPDVVAPLLQHAADARGLVSDLVGSLRGAVTEWERLGVPSEEFLDALEEHAWPFLEAYRQRYALTDLLGRIGPPATEATPVLEPLASSEDPLLRYLARRSLRRISSPTPR